MWHLTLIQYHFVYQNSLLRSTAGLFVQNFQGLVGQQGSCWDRAVHSVNLLQFGVFFVLVGLLWAEFVTWLLLVLFALHCFFFESLLGSPVVNFLLSSPSLLRVHLLFPQLRLLLRISLSGLLVLQFGLTGPQFVRLLLNMLAQLFNVNRIHQENRVVNFRRLSPNLGYWLLLIALKFIVIFLGNDLGGQRRLHAFRTLML